MGTKKRCCHGSHTQQHGRLPNHSTSDTRRPNVWRVVDILVIARRAQPPRCTDGPFNWSSLSHGNDLSAILCVHGQLFTTIQERSSWDNSLSLTQTGRFYYSLNTRQKMTFFFPPSFSLFSFELLQIKVMEWNVSWCQLLHEGLFSCSIDSLPNVCWGCGSSMSLSFAKSWAIFAGTWLSQKGFDHRGDKWVRWLSPILEVHLKSSLFFFLRHLLENSEPCLHLHLTIQMSISTPYVVSFFCLAGIGAKRF